MKVSDIELNDWQIKALLKHRGGCHCATFGNPPCSNCTNPLTEDEAEALGFIPVRSVCVDATGVALTEGKEYDVVNIGYGFVELDDDSGFLKTFFSVRFREV